MPHDPIPEGTDPRAFFRKHRERGPKQWTYTYKDIAQLVGISESSIRKAISGKRLHPETLRGVVMFVLEYTPRGSRKSMADLWTDHTRKHDIPRP